MHDMKTPIKNVILDLGGVLLNLSFPKTEEAFRKLGLDSFNDHFSQFKASPLFEDLETGKITKAQFLDYFRKETGLIQPDIDIVTAWNAMLLDFPADRVEWLANLSKKYRVFLYSNTNAFHHDAFQLSFQEAHPGKPFDAYFEKAYYSHSFGWRKPYKSSFEALLKEMDLHPAETVFIDDTLPNVEGAREAGMQAIHLEPGMTVMDLAL